MPTTRIGCHSAFGYDGFGRRIRSGHYRYTPFGLPEAAEEQVIQPLGYMGAPFEQIGVYRRNRWYDPGRQRFLSLCVDSRIVSSGGFLCATLISYRSDSPQA